MVDEEAEPIRPEIVETQIQLAKLQIDNWLIFLTLLQAEFERIPKIG